jgi:intracellular septation protein A
MLKGFATPSFLGGVVIPLAIFFTTRALVSTIAGALAAMTWAVCFSIAYFAIRRKVDFFGVFACAVSAIALVGALVSNDPRFFYLKDPVSDASLSAFMLASALIKKPVMRYVAEAMGGDMGEDLKAAPIYARTWTVVTLWWAGFYATTSALGVLLYSTMNVEAYLPTLAAISNVGFFAMLAISFKYPHGVFAHWYRERYEAAAAAIPNGETP